MSGVLNETLFHEFGTLNLSMVGILICFVCMVVYILNMTIFDEGLTSVIHLKKPVVPKVNYETIPIPFSCILEESNNQKEKRINLTIKFNNSCLLYIHWQVCTNQLRSILHLAWPQFIKQINNSESLQSYAENDVGIYSNPDGKPQSLTVPIVIPKLPSLGKPPRTKFPLMVCIQRTETTKEIGNQVGALVCIVHISDDDCPKPSIMLYQYLKQYSGQLTQLQSLYTMSSELSQVNMDNENNYDEEMVSIEEACVICKVLKPVKAFLPCRHVCVCTLCFPQIDNCPMCRSNIESFFLTDNQEAKRQEEIGTESSNSPTTVRHRYSFSNLNGVLNSYLGIGANE